MIRESIKKFSYPVFYILTGYFIYRFLREVGPDVFASVDLIVLTGSLLLCIAAYCIFSWALFLYISAPKLNLNFHQVFVASNKYILGKYLPGKIWQFSGLYILLNQQYSKKRQSVISLSVFQIISLCAGTVVSVYSVGSIYTDLPHLTYWFLYAGLLLVWMVLRITAQISTTTFLSSLLLVAGWFLMGLSFYACFEAFRPGILTIKSAMIYPFSVGAGIVAIIAPGGLGIREFIAGAVLQNLKSVDVALIASSLILMRLVSLFSEIILTGIAWIYPKFLNKQ